MIVASGAMGGHIVLPPQRERFHLGRIQVRKLHLQIVATNNSAVPDQSLGVLQIEPYIFVTMRAVQIDDVETVRRQLRQHLARFAFSGLDGVLQA